MEENEYDVYEDDFEDTEGLEESEESQDSFDVDNPDEVFQSEDRLVSALKVTKGDFTIDMGVVEFKDLLLPDPIREARKETCKGLLRSIGEMGIIQPIHVMVTEGYADWIEEQNGGEYPGYKYAVLDGMRRIWAGAKNGLTRSNAIIWDFKDKDKGTDLVVLLSRVLNKNQRNSWSETWYLYQLLESQSALSPGTMEYLLQMNPGDAMKLKDIMYCDYEEVKQDLLSNKKDINQAYNALQKLRKEEDQLILEDNRGVSDIEQAEGVIQKSDGGNVSDEDVKELLGMDDDTDIDSLTEEDFDELAGNNEEDYGQQVGERHELDPVLRKAVLERDQYRCAITGRGAGLPMHLALSILNVHHVIPVHCGGKDTMDNLITVELSLHTLIHVIENAGGKICMSKEDFDNLPEEEKKFIFGAMKLARKAVEADKKTGKSKEEIYKANKGATTFKMPGTDQKINMQAIKGA